MRKITTKTKTTTTKPQMRKITTKTTTTKQQTRKIATKTKTTTNNKITNAPGKRKENHTKKMKQNPQMNNTKNEEERKKRGK